MINNGTIYINNLTSNLSTPFDMEILNKYLNNNEEDESIKKGYDILEASSKVREISMMYGAKNRRL
ncbi:hypothetical protein CM240_0813 [Clostridium bornimense]|uniref:Uncharacterized protein n=1 Tax=Clostridium bornimense TaxID=1216932 RepID=W6RUL0_9CLOT|nr:hypothetical protein [Clostridium bornimense]CDM67978.1 hypothetical protein CM240_0813 [Clostridium bornimense]